MRRWLLCAGLTLAPAGHALAASYVVPPIMPVPTAWQGRGQAVVRVLDKLDAHVETLTLKAGSSGSFKSLDVTLRGCMDRPDGLAADSAAYLDIHDQHATVPGFTGWTFSAEPSVGVFESPIYAVQLVSCAGDAVAPAAPPLPQPVPPPASMTQTPDAAAAPPAAQAVDPGAALGPSTPSTPDQAQDATDAPQPP